MHLRGVAGQLRVCRIAADSAFEWAVVGKYSTAEKTLIKSLSKLIEGLLEIRESVAGDRIRDLLIVTFLFEMEGISWVGYLFRECGFRIG